MCAIDSAASTCIQCYLCACCVVTRSVCRPCAGAMSGCVELCIYAAGAKAPLVSQHVSSPTHASSAVMPSQGQADTETESCWGSSLTAMLLAGRVKHLLRCSVSLHSFQWPGEMHREPGVCRTPSGPMNRLSGRRQTVREPLIDSLVMWPARLS